MTAPATSTATSQGFDAQSSRRPVMTDSTEQRDRSKLALQILFAATLLGVMADALLRPGPGGVNLTLWSLSLAQALVYLRTRRGELTRQEKWLLVPVMFFALTFVWRDSDVGAFNFLACPRAWAVGARASLTDEPWDARLASFREYIWAYIVSAAHAMGGVAPLVFLDKPFDGAKQVGGASRMSAVGRGIALSLPFLFVFGALFSAADPVFGKIVSRIVDFDIAETMSHIFLTGFFAWISAGYLRGALLARRPHGIVNKLPSFTLGTIEVGVTLGAINALFLSFVALQISYLFGGAEHVANTVGVTYAEYARHGFFELVFVALLALPLLLLSREVLPRGEARADRMYRAMAGMLLVLLGVVLVSAGQRMRLYQSIYGLTEDRVIATAFMIWLAVVFAWFAMTVLRGRPARFAFGAVVSGWVILGALNVANPSALIMRTNLARLAQGKEMDVRYALVLGADAVPALVRSVPLLPVADRCTAAEGLLSRYVDSEQGDWRTSSLGRWRARRLVRENEASLRVIHASCPKKPPADSH
jgi:hypothetical protein